MEQAPLFEGFAPEEPRSRARLGTAAFREERSATLFPEALGARLPEGHLARRILLALSRMDLSALYRSYSHRGGSPYPPERLLAVVLFGMSDGVRSERDLQEHCRYDERYRFLMGGLEPDDRTFGRFLARLDGGLGETLFSQVLALARSLNVVRADEVAVDGCKLPGACSFWSVASGNPSDPEALLQNSHGRMMVGYNAQLAIDVSHGPGLVVGALVLSDQNDWEALPLTLEAMRGQYGSLPDRALADSGYESASGIHSVEQMGVDTGVCPKHAPSSEIRENAEGTLMCPAGKPLVLAYVTQGGGRPEDAYRPLGGCRGCPLAAGCAFKGKRLTVPAGADPGAKVRNRDRWRSQAFSGAAKRRRKAETPFAHLRRHDRFERFRRKGRARAQTELLLWCVSYNLRKLQRALEKRFGRFAKVFISFFCRLLRSSERRSPKERSPERRQTFPAPTLACS